MLRPSPELFYGKPLVFEPGRHRYSWDGVPVPGVTTILGRLDKPALVAWAAKMACEHIEEHCPVVETDDGNGFLVTPDALADARKAHTRKRDAAADAGHEVHAYAEAMLRGDPPPPLTTDEAIAGACAFEDWVKEHDVEPLSVERRIFSRQHWFAGTTDFVGRIDGEAAVLDFKTSSGLYDSHWWQMTAYEIALREEGVIQPGRLCKRWLIHLNKTTGIPKAYSKTTSSEEADLWISLVNVHRIIGRLDRAKKERQAARRAAKKAEKAAAAA